LDSRAGLDAVRKRKNPLTSPIGNRTPVVEPVGLLTELHRHHSDNRYKIQSEFGDIKIKFLRKLRSFMRCFTALRQLLIHYGIHYDRKGKFISGYICKH
jgi:hypothetical protein